ncbi:MAG: hypothetical protein QW379_03930 [Thermoplasmata archaeon]
MLYTQPQPPYQPPPQPAYGPGPAYQPPPPYGAPYPYGYQAPKERSSAPVAGGALLIIGGILALINGALIGFAGGAVMSIIGEAGAFLLVCAAIEIVFGCLILLGGAMAVQRKSFPVAIVGAIFCMISIGPLFLSSILGLIALILIAISKDSFA